VRETPPPRPLPARSRSRDLPAAAEEGRHVRGHRLGCRDPRGREKAEATFFNFDFPRNYFHLRARLYPPPPGPLPEAEIHARLLEALGQFGEADLAPLRAAAAAGTAEYAEAFLERVVPDPRLAPLAPVILYRTLPLPDDVREGAAVLGLALRAAMDHGPSLERAGFGGPPLAAAEALFTAILAGHSGVVFAVDDWAEVLDRIATPDGKLHLALPDLLAALNELCRSPEEAHDDAFPFVLSAGERRSFTANTIIRDPAWRKTDARGALRMSPSDAAALGIGSGDSVRLTTRRSSVVVSVEVSDRMQRGHVSLPNGLGTSYPDGAGLTTAGVAPNELTAAEERDPFVGTPWHKHVPARIERVASASAVPPVQSA
jgi:anaerobic selenocysteine-containing dehydrogenase